MPSGMELFNNLIHEVKFINIQYNNAKDCCDDSFHWCIALT